MKPVKFGPDKIAFRYKGTSVFATGNLATMIAISLAITLLLWGFAAFQKTSK